MARIIAADDDLALQRVYSHMLDTLGHDFEICVNGQDALNAFRREPADLLILDINMPVMSGLDTCREIRMLPEGINVPVIIVSANDSESDIAAGFNAGANDYLLKPIRETALVAKLKNFLKISSLNRRELDLVSNRVRFLDRYKIEKVLGYGSHSVVFLAEDLQAGKYVAVKLLNENVSDDKTLKRFIELVSEFKRLENEHFTAILDYGQHNGQIYMILEYAADGNLRKQITTAKTLDEQSASLLAVNILDALAELEQNHLAHLDVKPENIIIHDGKYKLTDFGMVYSRGSATIPLKSEVWGTVSYVSPESLQDTESLDVRSDVYSLGITLFEAVTGDNPFMSDKPLVSMFRQVNLVPMPISLLINDFSCEFSDLAASMMSKNPDDRPPIRQLRDGFSFILECHQRGNHATQLSYPDPETRKRLFLSQETVLRQSRGIFDAFGAAKEKPKSKLSLLIDKCASSVYNAAMFNNTTLLPYQRRKLRAVALVIIAGICFNVLGYYAITFLHYRPTIQTASPLVKTMCRKCGLTEVRSIDNIADTYCRECNGPLGFAISCGNCKHQYPWTKPELPKDTPREQRHRLIMESMKCPACQQYKPTYYPPAAKP